MSTKEDTESEAEELLIEGMARPGGGLGDVYGVIEVQQMMSPHPKYLHAFMEAHNTLLGDINGPLPLHHRHYIAIMAAARHQCVYLMRVHAHEFLQCGGDVVWLEKKSQVPKKLQILSKINLLLAHRPWLMNREHLQVLLRSCDNTRWSLSELMQALMIMIHVHTLSSFVYGCSITSDGLDRVSTTSSSSSSSNTGATTEDETGYSSDSSTELNSNVTAGPNLEQLMENMAEVRAEEECQHDNEPSHEERLQRFRSVENQSAEISVPMKEKTARLKEAERFVGDLEFAYLDFASKQNEHVSTFRIQDYSWEDHAYPLVDRLSNNIGHVLDKKFDVAFNLTYNTMGHNDEVDTTAFREAIWYYIHCMYGIRHDDYDYNLVNRLLDRNLKKYIKTVTCYPERVSKRESEIVMKTFKHSERVHVNFMIMEARMQAELLYALRTVNNYMTYH